MKSPTYWVYIAFWAASLVLLVLDWRSGKLRTHTPRDPPFKPPTNADDIEDDDGYHHIPPARRTTFIGDPGPYDKSDALGSPFADSHQYNAPGQTAYTPAATTPSIPVASRPSMDAYGAFSDPAPTGYGPYGHRSTCYSRTRLGPSSQQNHAVCRSLCSRTSTHTWWPIANTHCNQKYR